MIKMLPIEEHASWLALDMVWGCPNDCAYCFLRDSALTGIPPRLEFALDKRMQEQIAIALHYCPEDVPVSIGNTTDLFLTEDSRNLLYRIMRLVVKLDPKRLIVMITKAEITDRIAKETADAAGGHGLIFLSQSFSKEYDANIERGCTSSPEATYRSFDQISKTEGLKAMHFWRPFLSRWNPTDQIVPRIQSLRNSGCPCSVAIGLKGGQHLLPSYSAGLRTWAEPELHLKKQSEEEWVSTDRLAELIALAKGFDYPVFRQTSCGIAFSQGIPDINGTSMSDKKHTYCENVNCPHRQRSVCSRDPLRYAGEGQRNRLLRRYMADAKIAVNNEVLIPNEIDEFSYNHLTHVLHRQPCFKSFRPSLVWRDAGNAVGGAYDTT